MARRHRVAMILAAPFPAPRGTQAWVAEAAAALDAAGHEVHVFCYGDVLGGDVPAGVTVHRAPQLPGVPAALGSRPTAARPLNDAALLALLLGRLPRLRPTVVHGHNHEGGLAAALAGRALGLPVIHQIHGALAEELPAWLAPEAAGRTRRSPSQGMGATHAIAAGVASPMAAGLVRLAGLALDRAVPRLAHAVVALDPAGARSAGRVPHVMVLPPAVSRWPAVAGCGGLPAGEGPWVAYAGNLDPYQSLDLLAAAWPAVRQTVPRARLALITHDAAPAPIPGASIFQAEDAAHAQALLASAEVAVVPRTGGAGYPVKLLNALGAGVPVVACAPSAKGLGPAEGVLPVAPTAAAFAEGLACVLRDRPLRASLSAGAWAFAAAHPWSAVAEALLRAYDRVSEVEFMQIGM